MANCSSLFPRNVGLTIYFGDVLLIVVLHENSDFRFRPTAVVKCEKRNDRKSCYEPSPVERCSTCSKRLEFTLTSTWTQTRGSDRMNVQRLFLIGLWTKWRAELSLTPPLDLLHGSNTAQMITNGTMLMCIIHMRNLCIGAERSAIKPGDVYNLQRRDASTPNTDAAAQHTADLVSCSSRPYTWVHQKPWRPTPVSFCAQSKRASQKTDGRSYGLKLAILLWALQAAFIRDGRSSKH